MRRHLMRPAGVPDARATIGDPPAPDLVATLAAIRAEAPILAPELIALIDQRADGVTALESATFILRMWRADGPSRERLIARAMKTPERNKLEAEIGLAIQDAVRSLARRPYSVERARDLHAIVVRMVRKLVVERHPLIGVTLDIAKIKAAVAGAIEWGPDRLQVRIDPIANLLDPPRLAS